MLSIYRNISLKKEFNLILNLFEENNLYFISTDEYLCEKNKLLNKKIITLELMENFINKYSTDDYTKIIYRKNYKKFCNNYKNKSDINFDIKFDKYLYIKFNQINNETIKKVIDILNLNSNNKYLIIDLRHNLGGNVEECAKLLREFVFKQNLFILNYKNKTVHYKDTADTTKYEVNRFERIYVWVSENTISSAEILALSLRHNVKGTYLLGNSTGGKKVGQSITIYEKSKFIFLCTTFKWQVEEDSKYSLEYYLKKDNNNIYSNIDDFYKATIQLSNFKGVEKN